MELGNVMALPLDASGNIALRIELMSGEVVEVSGNRVQLLIVSGYTFVEDVSFD
jgi:hypothetical protein